VELPPKRQERQEVLLGGERGPEAKEIECCLGGHVFVEREGEVMGMDQAKDEL
jgi:hypothetical protein